MEVLKDLINPDSKEQRKIIKSGTTFAIRYNTSDGHKHYRGDEPFLHGS